MRFFIASGAVLGAVLIAFHAAADNTGRVAFVPAEGAVPDLTQTDPKGNFARGGRSYCGPVAVSNSLMALFARDLKWEDVTQYDLVNNLASLSCMNTDPLKGTSVRQLLRGVDLYLERRGERDYHLKFQGWRRHDLKHRTGVTEPRLDWIKGILAQGGAVWLNVGWYVREKEGVYKRLGGHWVTAVGYGQDAAGDPQPDCLVIHDPAPRAGLGPQPQFVKMAPFESGKLTGVMRGLPRPARNLYRMEGGMHIKPTADLAILDGAAGLVLKPKPAQP